MQKTLLCLLIAGLMAVAGLPGRALGQSVTETATGVVNVATTSTKIMKVLTPSLGLTKKQQPTILKLVTVYLLDRNNLIPTKSKNESEYNSKFSVLNNGFMGKMKTALTVRQFAKFLGLKPNPLNTAAVLWILFF